MLGNWFCNIMHPSCYNSVQYRLHNIWINIDNNSVDFINLKKKYLIKVAASNESSSSIPSPSQSISLITIESSPAILAVGDTVVLPTQGGSNLQQQQIHQHQQQQPITPVSRDISSTGGVMTGYYMFFFSL